MTYYIYLTTNKMNGMKYIGKHHGELHDSYIGSGTALRKAIDEFGKDAFEKEILYISQSEEENCEKEREFIAKYNAVADPMFYNCHEGGNGGNTMAGWSEERRNQHSELMSVLNSGCLNGMYGKHHTEETKQKIRENRDTSYMQTEEYRQKMAEAVKGEKNGMYGKHHTEETKQKMSEKKKGKKLGSENSNAKKISAYEDKEMTKLVKEFDCKKDALIFVNTTNINYSGLNRAIKEGRPYKGYYWKQA